MQVVLDGARADEQLGGDLRVGVPLGREPGDLRLLRGELVDRLDGTFAHRLAGGRKLTLSALGERSRAHSAEHLVGRAQLLARVDATVLTTQPLAVQKAAAAEFERRATKAAMEVVDIGGMMVREGNPGDDAVNNWIAAMMSLYSTITGKEPRTSVGGPNKPNEGIADGPLIRFLQAAAEPLEEINFAEDAFRSRGRTILKGASQQH